MTTRTRFASSAAAAGALVAGGIAAVTGSHTPAGSATAAPNATAATTAGASSRQAHVAPDRRTVALRAENRAAQRHLSRLTRRMARDQATLAHVHRGGPAGAAAGAPAVALAPPRYAPAPSYQGAQSAYPAAAPPVIHSHTGASGGGSHAPGTHSHTGASGAGSDDGSEHESGGDD